MTQLTKAGWREEVERVLKAVSIPVFAIMVLLLNGHLLCSELKFSGIEMKMAGTIASTLAVMILTFIVACILVVTILLAFILVTFLLATAGILLAVTAAAASSHLFCRDNKEELLEILAGELTEFANV